MVSTMSLVRTSVVMKTLWKLFGTAFCCLVGYFIVAFIFHEKDLALLTLDTRGRTDNNIMNDKWIVITTVSNPTKDIQLMAELVDWRIVVVADKKTPSLWKYNNCVFLSIDAQKALGYEIVSLLPYSSYTRKMIGYLYAVQHGAKYIYDTDDDNRPIKTGLKAFDFSNDTSGLVYQLNSASIADKSRAKFFNIYAHFGRPDIWPRGYPLEYISDSEKPEYSLCESVRTPIIQQGLVDQDADVDAIYRMVFVKNKSEGLNIQFDSTAPPLILAENVYCPFNSQNTLFHYDAFWALLLPTTVTFRVTDIWRGYWAQRLLHLTGNYLGFYPPNARQHRNPHNYHKDFLDEDLLYSDSSQLMDALQGWTCKFSSFPDCVIDLSEFMYLHKFWQQKDVQLVKSWIKDLSNLGYVFPKLVTNESTKKCPPSSFLSNFYKRLTWNQYKTEHLRKVTTFCQSFIPQVLPISSHPEGKPTNTKDVVLIIFITVSTKKNFEHIPFLHFLFEPWFANVIFCSQFNHDFSDVANKSGKDYRRFWTENDGFSFVNLTFSEMNRGIHHYMCLNKVAQMKISNVKGYLVAADDMLLNFWNFFDTIEIRYGDLEFPRKKTLDSSRSRLMISGVWNVLQDVSTLANISNEYKQLQGDMQRFEQFPYLSCICDIYYVPAKYANQFRFLSSLYWTRRVDFSAVVPQILALLGWSKLQGNKIPFSTKITEHTVDDEFIQASGVLLKGKYNLNQSERGGEKMFKFYDKTDFFLHPVKLTNMVETEFKRKFCDVYVKSYVEAVVDFS